MRDGIGYRMHTRACRDRIRGELMKTEAGKARIEKALAKPHRRAREPMPSDARIWRRLSRSA